METLETPEFIFFDLGKVLLDFSHDQMCQQMADAVGISPERAREIVFSDGLGTQYETGLIDSEQFCERFSEAAGRSVLADRLLESASDIFTVKTEMISLVSCLATSGHRIGILSNTCPAHWEFVAHRYCFLRSMFSEVVLSYEERSMKPDSAIFRKASERVGIPLNKIFFVDDRPENVQGAVDVGMDAHLFSSAIQVQRLLRRRGVQFNY